MISRFIDVSLPTFFKFSKQLNPVPAGIKRPIITFSFNPFNQSFFPSIAASVKTRVVSWKLAAEIKLSLFKEAFVKPNNNGSSFGVSKVDRKKNLEEAISEARKYSDNVIIEKAYNHAEYTVGILKGEALTPLEIIAEDEKGFYNYEAKYLSKATKKVEVVDEEEKTSK